MSLLLDALKKAADDKDKKSREVAVSRKSITPAVNDKTQVEELSLQSDDDPHDIVELQSTTFDNNPEELSLDDIETAQDEALSNKDVDSVAQHGKEPGLEKKEEARHNRQNSSKGEFVISDDALSMLIYKTNHDVKQSRRIILSGILLISVLFLASGGAYYYMDMTSEIAAMERKHQIAMQSMRSKTNNEKTPEKTEIIRNLVSDAELEAKVEYAKKHIANEKKPVRKQPLVKAQAKGRIDAKPVSSLLSIERTSKADPVGEMLNDAWLAYEDGYYIDAKQLYEDILAIEANNRDALLGLGAIAIIEKDRAIAREIYLSLLNLDPRDSIATAALASLHSDESSLAADEEYLLSVLKKNPDAPHLNFALGNVYAQSNKWTAAQKRYFNAWQHDSENADYIFNLAVSMDQLSKQQQAINLYKDSLLKAANRQVSFSREAAQKRINELTRL